MKNIDFIERLKDKINALNLAIEARLDYLDEKEGLVIYALPGGKVEDEDLAGTQTVSLPYEIAIKSQDQALNNVILWQINAALSSFDLDISSSNGSYTFLSLTVEAPSLNDLDEQGFYVYLLDVTAFLEIERK
ncbi:minor capsid protein [Streptococcus hyointestinalis]|uniref:Minor capsid protein n=1 Tax=Streptococcus hyointestinalis TaxID=1337 RepID=A0A380K8Z1_9STRE|nr:minor capsid protein [Streptococcus hyointestinalis]SUN60606.1 minor capsid protein [Streptococcus hyointestinalis]